MAYAASIEHLLDTLRTCARDKVDALASQKRRVTHGLLSVGLKVHCLRETERFGTLIAALGGEWKAVERNIYKRSDARFCMVLPPVGSARDAVTLLECIEQYTGCRMLGNPSVQLQVCSPGRLNPRYAALHAIGFYLSSDTLRQYSLEDFTTTVSDNFYRRGKRLVIYDAGLTGIFDSDFAWWARSPQGLSIRHSLPLHGRTDIIVGPGSRADISNINLIATLLVHAQSSGADGYWSSLGQLFVRDLTALLDRHMLAGLADAPWVCACDVDGDAGQDFLFLSALQELTAYAEAEAGRLQEGRARSSSGAASTAGILHEVQEMLSTYRAIVTSITEETARA